MQTCLRFLAGYEWASDSAVCLLITWTDVNYGGPGRFMNSENTWTDSDGMLMLALVDGAYACE